MQKCLLVSVFFIFTNFLIAYDEAELNNPVRNKIYLPIERLHYENHQFYFVGNYAFLPLKGVMQDHFGYYVEASQAECRNGHIGFRKVGKTWYCLEQDCEYFYGHHF